MKTPYEILGVSNNASIEQIKSAFRIKAKETHPDLNINDLRAKEKFIEVTNAYKTLCDPILKKELDEHIRGFGQANEFNSKYNDGFESQMLSDLIRDLILNMHYEAEPYKKEASKSLGVGLAWLFGGLLITFWSYSAAVNSGGGSYVVTYGAILFGFLQAFRGISAYVKINNVISNYEKDLWKKFDEVMSSYNVA